MDPVAKSVLGELNMPNLITIPLDDFEKGDNALLSAKSNRSRIEYYFTCTPSLPLYVLNNWPEVDLITYLDADLFFFSSPEPIFSELSQDSIGIIEHRFPKSLEHLQQYGIYNIGWLMFRRDTDGLACLEWWRERCIEWCYDKHENGRFADQKYLDTWPRMFSGIRVIEHKGANVGPWNLGNTVVTLKHNQVCIDDDSLIFFHFQGFRHVFWKVYDPNLQGYGLYVSEMPVVRNHVIRVYISALLDAKETIRRTTGFATGHGRIRSKMPGMSRSLKTLVSIGPGIVTRRFVISLIQ